MDIFTDYSIAQAWKALRAVQMVVESQDARITALEDTVKKHAEQLQDLNVVVAQWLEAMEAAAAELTALKERHADE